MKKILILLIAAVFLTGCSGENVSGNQVNAGEQVNSITELTQLDGRKMGCMSGSIFDQNIEKSFPSSEIVYFNGRAELLMGLKSGKIDGYLADEPVAMMFAAENEDVRYLSEPVDYVDYGICFSKAAANKREQFNEFLKAQEESGHINELKKKWICPEGLGEKVAKHDFTGENGTITAVTTPDAAPFSFFSNQQYQGYEVELLSEFCEEYGYRLDISGTSFDALISSVASNKYDIAFNGIYITEERKKSVDFCEPTHTAGVVAMVRSGKSGNAGFFEKIVTSFKRTFLEEDRWKLIVSGMEVTLVITILSMAFGTLLGFGLFYAVRKKGKTLRKIADGASYIVSGLPAVLLLMILFYIVFAKSEFSGTAISIIGFMIIECMNIYDMFKTGYSALGNGQYEAALALGYTDTQAFMRIQLPQIARIIFPSYKKEIVTLIKATAIVGYVTVQDLTRVSDIIRSRTYDVFFPLFVTAVIYFLLAWILRKIVEKAEIKMIKHRKETGEN